MLNWPFENLHRPEVLPEHDITALECFKTTNRSSDKALKDCGSERSPKRMKVVLCPLDELDEAH